jgi:hypothetical protein
VNVTAEPNGDYFALHLPDGFRGLLISVAFLKYALVHCEMSNNELLEILEGLNRLVCGTFTSAALAAVQPLCDASIEIVQEARKLDGPWRTCAVDGMRVPPDESYRMLTSESVFRILLNLNPSFNVAARIMLRHPQSDGSVSALNVDATQRTVAVPLP